MFYNVSPVICEQDTGDYTLYPGKGIGKGFIIGATNIQHVEKYFGPAIHRSKNQVSLFLLYHKYGLSFEFNLNTGLLDNIILTSNYYQTCDGITVGLELKDAMAKYKGELIELIGNSFYFCSEGIIFTADNVTGKITIIQICTPDYVLKRINYMREMTK